MRDIDLPEIIKAMKSNSIKQIESACSWGLVFFDEKSSNIISIDRRDYENIKKGLFEIEDYMAVQEPYLISGLKFFKIEFNLPF